MSVRNSCRSIVILNVNGYLLATRAAMLLIQLVTASVFTTHLQ